jgi:methyl-accepting chemotaxis protein
MEEMTATVKQNADNARLANKLARAARDQAENGGAIVEQTVAAMAAIDSSSKKIADIISVIDEIAFQTNLLALNAAVEAARAGEQGRGFSVVADEVRKLAEESQQAAATIASLIAEIQEETHRAVSIVSDGRRRSEEGVAVTDEARSAFVSIGESIGVVTRQIGEIAEAIGDVATVAEESSASTQEVAASTQETTESIRANATSADALAATAGRLEELVDLFKLD